MASIIRDVRRTCNPTTQPFTCDEITLGGAIDPKVFVPPKAVLPLKPESLRPVVDADGKPTYQVVERQLQHVASIRLKCKPTEISAKLAEMLPEVMAHLNASGAAMAGAPFSRYHALNETEIDLEAGIPVQQPIEAKGRVASSSLPAGKAITCWHVGPYDKLTAAHQGLRTFLEANKYKALGGPWEIYWTDPGMVPDPTKWRTQLFAPIE